MRSCQSCGKNHDKEIRRAEHGLPSMFSLFHTDDGNSPEKELLFTAIPVKELRLLALYNKEQKGRA